MGVLSKIMLAGVVIGQFATTAIAAEENIGEREYQTSCTTCHGPEGKGDGNFSAFLNVDIPDLTQLANNNDGAFPLNRVYGIIDGREELKIHGERYMTIWGIRYNAEAIEELDPFGPSNVETIERMVRGRILELIFYLQSIQE